MSVRKFYMLTLAWLMSFTIISCSANKNNNSSVPKIKEQVEKSAKAPQDFSKISNTFLPPTVSGPVKSVPWENESEFKRAYADAKASTRMAAFCTVLKDPLPGEEQNVHLAAKLLRGIILKPGDIFSQNERIGPYSEEKGFKEGPIYIGTKVSKVIGGGVCKVASTLYNTAVLGDLQIVERHEHNMPVPYVPYGQDATVSYGSKDFKFKNDTGYPLMIWAQGIDNALYIAFYGRNNPPIVEWQHETLNKTKAPVIYEKKYKAPFRDKEDAYRRSGWCRSGVMGVNKKK